MSTTDASTFVNKRSHDDDYALDDDDYYPEIFSLRRYFLSQTKFSHSIDNLSKCDTLQLLLFN